MIQWPTLYLAQLGLAELMLHDDTPALCWCFVFPS